MTFTDDLYEALAVYAPTDATHGYPLRALTRAVGGMFELVDDLVRDDTGGPGWSALLDVDRVPADALPYLAQFVGVTLPESLDEATMRAKVRAVEGMGRGSVATIKATPKPYLTGTRTVLVHERDESAYRYTVVTYDAETPDPDIVEAALLAGKPAGLTLNYVVLDGQDWSTLLANHPTWQDVKTDYDTWADVRDDTP